MYWSGGGGAGILFDVTTNGNIVVSNEIVTTGASGISTESGSGFGNDDLRILNNSITGALNPIVILLGNGNIIEGNDIQNSGASRLWGGSNNIFRNNVIKEGAKGGDRSCRVGDVCQVVSLIDCNLDMGIHVSGETGTVVTGNTVPNVVGEGIVVSDLVREKRDFTPETLQTCRFSEPRILPPTFGPRCLKPLNP